ncbi:MAG TPA: hypothetical protein PK024_11875 [Methanospirillum sp.]|uniref:hypothetical protein n=1 Tax=Methanospirillum sp. TaxID=45200 RepID=UPI002D01C452|nr:hypothetical protein [Methanospirillum sp.]HOJ97520.1 hypothetical protein [Methanospirillum sp.]HOL40752.1 hypothetical protein [Methanospirillum sp.]HPP78181.1 hypothetical protein [Methanospirillum sp.]
MLEKVGYMQKAKTVTIDEDGLPTEIIEIVIDGKRFGILIDDLKRAIRGKISARTFQLRINWKQYISTTAGLAYLSYSGKALNIEMIDGNRYTVSLDSLKSLMCRRSSYAPVARLPMSSTIKCPSIMGTAQKALATC